MRKPLLFMRKRSLLGSFIGRHYGIAGLSRSTGFAHDLSIALSFLSDVISSLIPSIGSGSYSFTRNDTDATVVDNYGVITQVLDDEVRFSGARRVHNLCGVNTDIYATETITVISGNSYRFSIGECTGSILMSGAATEALAGSATDKKSTDVFVAGSASLTITVTGSVLQAQLEDVTDKPNKNPSEYVSFGAGADHGTNEDGVRYFQTTNQNQVVSNIVTTINSSQIRELTKLRQVRNRLDDGFATTKTDVSDARRRTLDFAGSWTQTLTGSGSIVLNADGSATFSVGIGDAAFKKISGISFVSGRVYALSCAVSGFTGDPSRRAVDVLGIAPSAGVAYMSVTDADNNTRVVTVFTASATEVRTVRFGLGLNAVSTTVQSVDLSNPMIQDITDISSIPDDYVTNIISANYNSLNSVSGQTLVLGITTFLSEGAAENANARTLVVGDSFHESAGDWMTECTEVTELLSAGVGGRKLYTPEGIDDIKQQFDDYIDSNNWDSVVIGGGINDIGGATSDPVPNMIINVKAMIETARQSNKHAFIPEVTPWKGSSTYSWTSARQGYTDDYNTQIADLASGDVSIVSTYSAMESATPDELEPTYDNGDGLHLNATGTTAYAGLINAEMSLFKGTKLEGVLIEPSRVGYFINNEGLSVVTQNIDFTAAGAGDYTISFYGSGTVTSADVGATGTGHGVASDGTDITFNLSVAGTVSFTVAGSDATTKVQVEKGSYKSSFIPVAGAAVTRDAESLLYDKQNVGTGDDVNNVVFSGSFVMPFDASLYSSNTFLIEIAANTRSDQLEIHFNASGNLIAQKKVGGVASADTNAVSDGSMVAGSSYKFAAKFSSVTGVSLFIAKDGDGGVKQSDVGSNTDGVDFSVSPSDVSFGSSYTGGSHPSIHFGDLKIHQKDLSDSQCLSLIS